MIELANTFNRSLGRLNNAEQTAAKNVVVDYMADPSRPGLSLHRVDRAKDKGFWTIRVNRDLRIVVYKQRAKSVFCYVGHHDDAYAWAAGRRFEVHPVTGAAQIVELIEVVREEIKIIHREAPKPGLLCNEGREYLLSLGVPETYVQLVQDVDQDGLMALMHRLPEEAQESLLALAVGERPEARPVMPASSEVDPFNHPDSQRRFWVASDEEQVARALQKPWAEWMVFLHPSQKIAVERNFNGPARISGSAGTGKSVVAMHRTALLAREPGAGRILLTTFSKILSSRLSEGMDALLGRTSDARQKVEVIHLHAYVYGHTSRLKQLVVADDNTIDTLIAHARGDLDPAITNAFLRSEWDGVIDFWGVKSSDEYREIPRAGRGTPLSGRLRTRLWEVFDLVKRGLVARELYTFGDICDRVRERIEADGLRPFQHVVVDEAQDLGPRELRLVAALAPGGPRSLVLAGDVGQRIFRWPFSWMAAGIDIRGRSQRLRLNYRTSAEIRQFSDRLLPRRLADVDGETEERGALSLLRGPKPEIKEAADPAGEIVTLSSWLLELRERGVPPEEIAIFARTRRTLQQRAEPALKRAAMTGAWLSPDQGYETGKVVLGTLHSAKGLEFKAVAIVACDDEQLPLKAALDLATEHDERSLTQDRELNLLYVGCTRARDRLLITWSGTRSRFLASAG